MLSEPGFKNKRKFYLADAVDKRWGNMHRKSKEKNPKIFFSKLLKEKGTSVAVLENFDKETMGDNSSLVTFEEIKEFTNDTDDKDREM